MASYKDPSFQERTALAQAARAKALAKLAARPAPDAALVAQRKAAAEAREKAQAEKSAARKAAILQAKADKAAAAQASVKAPPSEEELKAARDERYAARKKRKG
jgi:DNA polymerase III delta subunit